LSTPATPEAQRLAALQALEVLDSAPEVEFDALVRVASVVCGVPVSLISLIDQDRQWFKANLGLDGVSQTPRDIAFCAHAIETDDLFEVDDATLDPRFATNPLVTDAPDIRFYAGMPLRLSGGMRVGTLCVIDRRPRHLEPHQREVLRCLGLAAVQALEGRQAGRALKAVMAQLAHSDQRLRHLYNATPAMMHSIDAQGVLVTVSDAWLARLGYRREEVVGRLSVDFLTPASRANTLQVTRPALLRDGTLYQSPQQMVTRSGEVVDILFSAVLEGPPTGQPQGALSVLEDVTLRRRAEQELAAEHERLAHIIDGTHFGTWEWHVPSGELRINARWATMLGWEPGELAPCSAQTWLERVHPDDLDRAQRALEAHLAGRDARYRVELRMAHRLGHWVWVLTRGKVLGRTENGEPLWMYGTHTDISERKAQEDLLRKQQSFLDRTGRMAGVGGWEVDLPTQAVTWSDQACRIQGVAPGFRPSLQEAIAVYAPESRPLIQRAVERATVQGEGWDLELQQVRADGRRIWVRSVCTVEYEAGVAVRLVGAVQDISEQVDQRLALQRAQHRIALATGSAGIGLWERDLLTGVLQWDAQMHVVWDTGNQIDEPLNEVWRGRVHPDDLPRLEQTLSDSVRDLNPFSIEFRAQDSQGRLRMLRSAGSVVQSGARGEARWLVGVSKDITRERQLMDDLAEQRERLQVTLQSIGDAVITTDAQGRVQWLNPVAERMTGWRSDEALGLPLEQVFRIVNEQTRVPCVNPVAVCLQEDKVVGLANHTLLISRDGTEHGIEDSAAPIRHRDGRVLGVVLVFHDVTEQRRLSSEMTYRATHDGLTGLINRVEFEARLRRLLAKAQGEHQQAEHALMFIDLDQFKLVNDACGHAVGDQLLQQVARLLAETVRSRDTLARLGGDEFAVLLENCSAEQGQRVAQQICERMDDFRFVHEDQRFRIGTSIGLVPVDKRWASTAAILQAADTSCYAAKEAGRNRVHVWFDSDQAMQARQGEMQWASRIEQALDEDRFVFFAQRIDPVNAEPGQGLHAELLLRMVGTDGALVPPGAFLPATERFHLASRLDRWVMRHALAWMKSLPSLDLLGQININLSGQSVGDRAFHRIAVGKLTDAGPALCAKLCLEITETTAVTNLADAAAFIRQVQALGVKVALDDFGAGASSFGYLKSLPVNYLKIDGQFIRDLLTDPLDEAAVRSFVDVAKVVGVKTVAEFVDSPAVLDRLWEMGVDHAQGFLLHRPEPVAALLASLPSPPIG
jgi:diguanylate cyclase